MYTLSITSSCIVAPTYCICMQKVCWRRQYTLLLPVYEPRLSMSALSIERVDDWDPHADTHDRKRKGSVHARTSEIHFQFSSSSAPDHLSIPSILSPSLTETPLTDLLCSPRGTEQTRARACWWVDLTMSNGFPRVWMGKKRISHFQMT